MSGGCRKRADDIVIASLLTWITLPTSTTSPDPVAIRSDPGKVDIGVDSTGERAQRYQNDQDYDSKRKHIHVERTCSEHASPGARFFYIRSLTVRMLHSSTADSNFDASCN